MLATLARNLITENSLSNGTIIAYLDPQMSIIHPQYSVEQAWQVNDGGLEKANREMYRAAITQRRPTVDIKIRSMSMDTAIVTTTHWGRQTDWYMTRNGGQWNIGAHRIVNEYQ
ncbi:MAG TPA: hypothetical protein PKM88_05950 [bacterium]|nr:hypothetical protein [bacterium]